MLSRQQLRQYLYLMRLDKPIGILLLLWPTLWALWLASWGMPEPKLLFIFIAGVVLMRSAGCILNDFADRHFDKHVSRTRERPLATGKISSCTALSLAALLSLAAFILVLFCNLLTIELAFIGAALTIIYPFMKRFTYLPQVGLGAAFAWGVPMTFAEVTGKIPGGAWFLFAICMLWPVMYDTLYAMVDRDDDLKIGVKSTAILFGKRDILLIALLQLAILIMLSALGYLYHLHLTYYAAMILVMICFLYQLWLIKDRDPEKCFQAFSNNHWIGMVIFFGIAASFSL